MSKITKTFKSGNSVAVRLPSALGVKPGTQVRVREEQGKYIVEPVNDAPRKLDISGFAGKAPWLKLAPRADFEERPSTLAKRRASIDR